MILNLKLQSHSIGKSEMRWTCPVLFGNKQSGLTFSIKAVPSGHMLSISSSAMPRIRLLHLKNNY